MNDVSPSVAAVALRVMRKLLMLVQLHSAALRRMMMMMTHLLPTGLYHCPEGIVS
jgi:hypothetical protein